MRLFLLNILLAIAWTALTASATLLNFVAGFLLGYLALAISHRQGRDREYFRRLPRALGLAALFLRELLVSSLRTIYEVLSPPPNSKPRIIRVPLEIRDNRQILTLTYLLLLTPGTLVLDVARGKDAIYVHTLFAQDAEAFRLELQRGFERRVREVMS
ncbi:Na+/H+ antiporter subunit E [Microbulbifer sp. 2201CG32-9]|uniref:Na+/H+ antiporter subunit E n=1 Tax=Microbulbifer sp. 2201CG32-9 TaxID=3232309 RepID=UPI00345B54DB